MAQPNSQEHPGSPTFGSHLNKKIKKINESREFGPVTWSLKALKHTEEVTHTTHTKYKLGWG